MGREAENEKCNFSLNFFWERGKRKGKGKEEFGYSDGIITNLLSIR